MPGACHADPPRRHGPYFQWTRKVANKTVGKWLSIDERDDYQAWVDNDRRAQSSWPGSKRSVSAPSKPIPAQRGVAKAGQGSAVDKTLWRHPIKRNRSLKNLVLVQRTALANTNQCG
jgi:hypothetical protein